MRYAVSNLHRTHKRTSSSLDSTISSVPNSKGFYPFTLIQTIIFILFCCQFIILTYLYFHFDFFQHSSLYDFKKSFILSSSHSSSHLLSPQEIHNNEVIEINNEEKPRREIHKTKIQAIQELKYEIYPVTIRSVDKTDHMKPSSKEFVQSLLGSVVEVDFPDLAYWTSESIKERYPTLFNELPKLGFHDDYKNPCWFRSMDSSNSNVDGGTSSVSRLVCLPYAYILGQPKSGTSDLFERLKAHPSIIMPTRKEVRWFTRGEFTLSTIPHEGEESDFTGGGEERRGERLLGKGSSIFTFTRAFMPLARALSTQPNRKNEFVTIDGGPHTLWWPTQAPDGEYLTKDVPPVQLIRELQPNAKFLITVVDPVKRFYSDYYFLGDDLKPVKPGRVGVKSPEQLHERVTEQIDLFNVCIKRYMKRLVPQYQKLKKKNSDANNQLFDDLPQLLKENNIKLDLSREYLTYFPLWFRSAQMCAHDRHTFAKGGWGRLSISLYILYLEKWYEYFPIDQFHIIRLEDYPNNPKQYLQSIFNFLNLPIDTDMKKEEEIWNKILVDKHYNQHRVARQPLLEETETLLRDFYRPYNQLLALVLRNQSFLWDPITSLGLTKTLREQLIEELKQPLPQQGRNGRIRSPPSPFLPPAKPQENQHSPERSKIFLHEDTEADVPPEQNPSQNLRGNSKPRGLLQLTPHAFSIDDLPLPPPKDKTFPDEPANNDDLTIFDGIDWTDTLTAGKHLCGAAFSLNLYHLKYLLYDIGIPSGTIYQNDGKRNAWHCLASIWSMGEAHSRSHVFAELKGRTTWVTNHLHPPLEKKIASVLSMDILSHLEEDILKVAQWLDRAKVPINALDVGGFTPLHHAVVGGEVGLIKFLISLKEIDINKLDHMHRNPLHYAAAYGHSEIIQLLVEKGGNIRQIDRHGVTPYDIIATPGPVSAEDALLYANITQRPARKIKRYLHPEYYSNDSVYGWVGGTGGWGAERLQGFEEDMECNGIDQYLWNEITSADIFSKYLSKNTPVLIRGLLNYWPVVKTFKQENLIKSFGEIRVQVSDIPYAQKFGGSDMVEMTLAEYIEEVKNHRLIGGQHPWYVFRGHPIPQGSESKTSFVKHETCPLPDLIKNAFLSACPIPPESGGEREMFVNAQWALGGEGTGAPVHFHNTAWAALLYGAKKWLIYPPHAMIMSNKQILNYYETDRITFEERGIKPITCVQTAGDVMIIPESYGHGVLNIQESIAIATEFKHSMWRIRPPPRIVGEVSEFDNRSDKKNNRPREARRVRKARPVT